jgi:hypothetical protein
MADVISLHPTAFMAGISRAWPSSRRRNTTGERHADGLRTHDEHRRQYQARVISRSMRAGFAVQGASSAASRPAMRPVTKHSAMLPSER